MKLWNIQQRTPEWDMARAGKYTGKKVKGIMGRTREEWENHLVAERLSMTGIEETDLQRGNRLEPEAIAHFEKHFKKKVFPEPLPPAMPIINGLSHCAF